MQEGYVVPPAAPGASVAREEYEKPLIFHDGRLVRRPTPAAAAVVFLWFPIGLVLAVVRLTVWSLLPYEVSVPMAAMLGVTLRVRGAPPLVGLPEDESSKEEEEDDEDDEDWKNDDGKLEDRSKGRCGGDDDSGLDRSSSKGGGGGGGGDDDRKLDRLWKEGNDDRKLDRGSWQKKKKKKKKKGGDDRKVDGDEYGRTIDGSNGDGDDDNRSGGNDDDDDGSEGNEEDDDRRKGNDDDNDHRHKGGNDDDDDRHKGNDDGDGGDDRRRRSERRRRSRRRRSRRRNGMLYVCTHRTLLDPIFLSVALRRRVTAVTYSLSRLSELLSPIRTVRLTRDRGADAATLAAVLARDGDLVICPEGTTCREPYLLRYSPLFAEISDGIAPVGIRADVGLFHGTTARGLKAADPFYFLMNPRPRYEVALLPPLPAARPSPSPTPSSAGSPPPWATRAPTSRAATSTACSPATTASSPLLPPPPNPNPSSLLLSLMTPIRHPAPPPPPTSSSSAPCFD
jgi:hypothetical protein